VVKQTDLARAAALICQGGLVAFPTETVYGLGANALNAQAVARIYEVKGRPAASPLIVHVDSVEMARTLTTKWPHHASTLASRYWPGPLTLVLPKSAAVPDIVTAGLQTVGIRVPAHPLALELIRLAGTPIAAPSANTFTRLSPTTADHVRESLGDRVDLILDGGATTVGIESTVLSLAVEPPLLLRPGMVSQGDIENLVGPVRRGGRIEKGEEAHPSPGLHHKHYSPDTPLVIVEGGALPAGRGIYLWRVQPARSAESVEMPREPGPYAAILYEMLHRADRGNWDWIAVERPPLHQEWAAIADRLSRAASNSLGWIEHTPKGCRRSGWDDQ